MPRFIDPVSTRTTNGIVTPVSVVVVAMSEGRLVVLGSGLKSLPPAGRYTYCTRVGTEQSGAVVGPSTEPSGSLNSAVWQTNG